MTDTGGSRPSNLTVAAAAAVGAIVFERCLGFAVIDPRALDWIFHWGIDPSVNFMGWHMFRSEAWSLPPGLIRTYGHPVGSTVGVTDSLPVIALPLKLVASYLPPTFQYLGLWYLACFVLLGVFGCLLVATATGSRRLQLLGAAIIVLSPTLVHRMGHASLSGHWLIVAALWLHVEGRDHGLSRGRFALWLGVLWVAAGATPYIAAMVAALAVPTVVGRIASGLRATLVTGAAFALVTGVGWWAGGYFVLSSGDLRNSGFGILSTNLLAPFDAPAGSLLADLLPVTLWNHDQLDGYCYLGLGVFWLVGVSVLRARPRVRRAWTVVDVSFALVCVVIALFALSSTITLGTRILFEYDPGWWGPLTTLRASGRFVWPLYYALVFGVVAIVVRRLPHGTAVAVLAVGVFLQAADLWGPMAAVRTARAVAAWDPLPSPFWGRVLPHYAHLVLNPTNMCSPAGSGFDYRYFALKAGSARVTINAGYAARHDVAALDAYCQALARETAERRVQEDTLYVVADQLVPVMQSAEVPVACARIDGVAVCFSTASHARWGNSFDVRHDPLPPDEEVLRFRDRLEAEYRDRMGRTPQPHRGTMSRRTQALSRYAALRINGCSDDEAAARVADPGTLATDVGLCPRQAVDALPLPPAEAVRHQRARLDTEWASREVPLETSAVDAEGEAVWLHAYFDLRRRGQTPEQATAEILATIRRIAP